MRSSFLIPLALVASVAAPSFAQDNFGFRVRDGFKVTLAAQNYGESRFLEMDDKGNLFVSQPGAGTISTLKRNADGTFEKFAEFTSGKPRVHGMHFVNGWLWFTQSGAVWKGRDTNGDGKADEEIKITDDLPEGGGHWWRSICVADDGFYTSIGDSGNINDETKTERQKIWKFNLDGTGKKLWSSGLRNTEKLRLRPGTNELWGADHGSDWFGKELGDTQGNQPITNRFPPDEFNHYVEGGFYGHPFVVGFGMPRLEFKARPDIIELVSKTIPPAWPMGAHWANNGWTFATRDTIGNAGDAYIACHGSWNSEQKVGYRVERVMFDSQTGRPMGSQMMVSTLDGQKVLDRPVDVLEDRDSTLLFSTSQGRKIYRISRK